MSRYLIAVPPLVGHVNPTLALGTELRRRGHDVTWAGHAELLRQLLPDWAEIVDISPDGGATQPGSRAWGEELQRRRGGMRGPVAFRFLWEEFLIPLAQATLPGMAAAIAAVEPDVVLADQQMLSAAVAARRAGIPWATSASTSSELAKPLAGMPLVEQWVRDSMDELQRGAGLTDPIDLRWSEELVLIYSTLELVGRYWDYPAHFAFVGPALTARPDEIAFCWDELTPDRRLVLASLGTVSDGVGERFLRTLVDAVADASLHIQLVLVAPPGVVDPVPANVVVRERVPQLALLERVAAVVCHGGHNTTCESLSFGLPLVVAPIRDDQPIIAQQVADAGAGVRVKFGRAKAAELRTALTAVLDDPSYRAAAGRIARSFDRAGGASAAVDRLERLALVPAEGR